MARVLIDSSVWIAYYRPGGSPGVRDAVQAALAEDRAVTTGLIVVEVLQGARTEADFTLLETDFSALPWLQPTPRAVAQAARWGFELARRGTPIPAIDLVIAAVAVAYDCELWHGDAHFERLKPLAPLVMRRPAS